VRVETAADPASVPDTRVMRYPSAPFWAYPQLHVAAPLRGEVTEGLVRWAPTMIHATTPFGVGLAGRSAARSLGVPFVSSHHTSYGDYLRHYGLGALDAVTWPYLRWFHNSGVMTFAPSQHIASQLRAQRIEDVRVWSRGVDRRRFHPRFRDATMRARAGAGPDDIVVAYVGRLAPEKGIHVALDAMRRVMSRDTAGRVRFALAGDGPDEGRCRALAPPRTWFAGPLGGDELSSFYASADLFVFPSTTETFGNVVLEAMSSGLPVIAADAGATLELAHEGTARLFRAGSSEDLANAIDALIADASTRDRLRMAGLAAAEARGWDAVWDRLFADYLDARMSVERPPHRGGAATVRPRRIRIT
jgi:phosphatidylinositol alpha 1,6-mannosyltransferase